MLFIKHYDLWKYIHNKFFASLNVLVNSIKPHMWKDTWAFKKPNDKLEALAPSFFLAQPHKILWIAQMCQNDMEFIRAITKFKTTFHTHIDINMLKITCLKTPPNDSKISHLFNTNKSTYNAHNDLVFQKTIYMSNFHSWSYRYSSWFNAIDLPFTKWSQ
jgi:hypothetical protein